MEYNNELLTFAIVITKKQYIMDLVNALKSIFTRNTSAASTSGARVPILNSSGEPIGSDTMPNLASVLGVNLLHLNGYGYTTDVNNNWNGIGWAHFVPGAPCANVPAGTNIGLIFYIGGTASDNNHFAIQLIVSGEHCFIRNLWAGSWNSWIQIK